MAGQRLPKTVQIGPLLWRISSSLGDYQALASSENDLKALGFTQLETLQIVLKPGMPRVLQQETLLHELLHAIIATQGGVFTTSKEDEHEEAAVSAVSPLLLTTLRDNVALREFILTP
jgi:hypothetical protein